MGLNLSNIKAGAGRLLAKAKVKSPEIAMAAGTVLVVGGAVATGYATIKAVEVVKAHKLMVEQIHEASELHVDEYTEKDKQDDLVKAYSTTAVKLARTYAAPVALVGGGLGCMWWSHGEMTKRNLALGTALAGARTAFENYRNRVKAEGGEELDRHYMYGSEPFKLTVNKVDENGKHHSETTDVEAIESVDISDNGAFLHQVLFSRDNSIAYTGEESFDKNFIKSQEAWTVVHLKSKGFVTLDEVYESIGIDISGKGYLKSFGWIYDPKHPEQCVYPEFKMTPIYVRKPGTTDEMEKAWVLEFNDLGYILDKI